MFMLEAIKLKIHQAINCRYAIILTYHSVVDVPLEFDIWTHMPVSLFEEHIATISDNAKVVPLSHLVERVVAGHIDSNIVAITFDDGFRNNFTQAYPILKKYGVPATIYLATDYIGTNKLFWPERVLFQIMKTDKKTIQSGVAGDFSIETPEQKKVAYRQTVNKLKTLPMSDLFSELTKIEGQLKVSYSADDPLFQDLMPLSWEEIKVMEKEGLVSFGGHTASHAILSMISEDEACNEMKKCKRVLKEHLSTEVKTWAYPNGSQADFSSVNKKQLCDLGFNAGILTMEQEYISSKSDVNNLGRFGVGSRMGLSELQVILSKRNRIGQYNGKEKVLEIAKGIREYLFLKFTLR
jgi:peptidoglycan/xylan/chitin deacetylase (PgdA/CDA1 family)